MMIGFPIVVDLGEAEEEEIRQLLRGGGRLAEEFDEVMLRLRQRLLEQNDAAVLVPIVALARDEPAH